MATSGFPQLRPSFVLSAGLIGGPKPSNHSWSLEGSWNAELEWTCLHTTHDATHVSRVGAFSSENRVQIASLHLAISKQTTIISTNPLWLMKAISLWVAIVQYPIKQTWWVAHKDRTLHRCGKDCPLHELRSSPTALLDLEPCKPYMDSAWYGWGMPNLSVLSYCPFRICPYHPLSLSKISYWLAGHWSSYCRHEIWYDTTAHIHRWNVCRIIKQEIWKYMDMLWVKTLNSRGVVANRPFTSTYRPLTANLHIATLGYLGHHWSLGSLGSFDCECCSQGIPGIGRIRKGDPGDRLGGPAQHVPSQAFETVHPPPALCSRTLRWLRNGEVKTWLIHIDSCYQ